MRAETICPARRIWLRIIREITMKFSRRSFGGAVAVAALALAGSLSVAFAGTAVPYSAEAFKAAQASGSPILVEIHADWCPTCKAQSPILDKLTADPRNSRI